MNQELQEQRNEAPLRQVTPRSAEQTVKPAVQIRQDSDGYTIEAEMPGVSRDGVDVTFEDGKLTLTGRRRARAVEAKTIHRESSRADYRRVFDLDPSVDASRIAATVEQGVLRVSLPKAEASKPRRIAIG